MPNSESGESSIAAGPLPLSGLALAQARRVVADLMTKVSSVDDFRDAVPYALDRIDNVWRTINTESRGSRTRAFASWWASEESHPNRVAVRRLRNLELKENRLTTRAEDVYKGENLLVVRADGTRDAQRPDGSMLPLDSDGTVNLGEASFESTEWSFIFRGIDDRPIQDILDTLLHDLETRVLPAAERLLQDDS